LEEKLKIAIRQQMGEGGKLQIQERSWKMEEGIKKGCD